MDNFSINPLHMFPLLSEDNAWHETGQKNWTVDEESLNTSVLVFVSLVSFGNNMQVQAGLQFLWGANIQPVNWVYTRNCFKVD